MESQQAAQDRELDEALAEARAAFAGTSDEEIVEAVSEVVDRARARKRSETPTTTSA